MELHFDKKNAVLLKEARKILQEHGLKGARIIREAILNEVPKPRQCSYLYHEKERIKRMLLHLMERPNAHLYKDDRMVTTFIEDNVGSWQTDLNLGCEFAFMRVAELSLPALPLAGITVWLADRVERCYAFFANRATSDQLTTFTRQLAQMVQMGLPLPQCFHVLAQKTKSGTLREMASTFATAIDEDADLSDILRSHPQIFSSLYIALVKTGEMGGVLEHTLSALADIMANLERERHYSITIAFYTALALYLVSMTIGSLLFPVIWQLWYLIPLAILVSLAIFKILMVTKKRIIIDRLCLSLPIVGPVIRRSSQALAARVLGHLITSGIPVLEAIGIAKGVIKNQVIANALATVHDSIREGESLAEPLAQSGVFDDAFIQMIDIGEKYGNLDTTLLQLAEPSQVLEAVDRRLRPLKLQERHRKQTAEEIEEFPAQPGQAPHITQIPFASSASEKNFEKLLSEDAGRPGPTERLIAQSVYLLKAIQATIGLKFILLANAFDIVLETISGYINGIFQAWQMAKTIKRKLSRHLDGKEIEALAENIAISRIQLSRLFSFHGFDLAEFENSLADPQKGQALVAPTFALKLVIESRCQLDEMKRDLAFLTQHQRKDFARKSLFDFLLSFIPNPLSLLSPWKDWFILAFIMKYSREEIETMYVEMVDTYCQMIARLEKKYRRQKIRYHKSALINTQKKLANHEQKLRSNTRLGKLEKFLEDLKNDPEMKSKAKKPMQNLDNDAGTNKLEKKIAESRDNLQRLIQMLANPQAFIDPRRWSRFDLLREAKQENANLQYSLELDRWLYKEVEQSLKRIGQKPDAAELQLRLQEAQEFRQKYQISRWLRAQFV